MSKKALVVVFPQFEEIEALAPVDLLRRAGAEVTIASLSGDTLVTGRSGIVVQTDVPLGDLDTTSYDLLVIPGGQGVRKARANPRLARLAQAFVAADKVVAAICAAPTILADAGLLVGRRFTAHFSTRDELPQALAEEPVVQDGNVITSRGAGTALQFGLLLVQRMLGGERADELARAIMM